MGWRFRKSYNWGAFRTSLTKRGWGISWGFPGFRYGVSPDGRRYISIGIPDTGLYWIKYLRSHPNNQLPDKPMTRKRPDDRWWDQKELVDKDDDSRPPI